MPIVTSLQIQTHNKNACEIDPNEEKKEFTLHKSGNICFDHNVQENVRQSVSVFKHIPNQMKIQHYESVIPSKDPLHNFLRDSVEASIQNRNSGYSYCKPNRCIQF